MAMAVPFFVSNVAMFSSRRRYSQCTKLSYGDHNLPELAFAYGMLLRGKCSTMDGFSCL